MKKQILVVILLGLIVCLTCISAQAQDTGKVSLFGGYSYMSNGWGNGCVGACFGGITTQLHGYAVSGVYSFGNHIGFEASFDGHNGSPTVSNTTPSSSSNGFLDKESQDLYTITFGPKLALPVGNFSLFTHFLVGVAHGHEGFNETCLQGGGPTCGTPFSSSAKGTGFAYKTGGGVDWNHGRWGIRILEVDYVHPSIYVTETCSSCSTQTSSFNISGNNFELSTGLTINFGMK